MKKYIFPICSVFALSLSSSVHGSTILVCEVSGSEIGSLGAKNRINETVSVVIESSPYLSIDIQGTDFTSDILMAKKYPSLEVVNFSNEDQWSLEIIGTSKNGTKYRKSLTINRQSGILAFTRTWGAVTTSYSGPCIRSTKKKF